MKIRMNLYKQNIVYKKLWIKKYNCFENIILKTGMLIFGVNALINDIKNYFSCFAIIVKHVYTQRENLRFF